MYRGRQIPTGKFEAWNRQLQIGVWKSHQSVEQIDRQWVNAQAKQAGIEIAIDGIMEDSVTLLGDGGVFLALGIADCGGQSGEMRTAIVTVAVQEHRAAKDDGRALRARPEQHRQNAEKEIVAHDDVGRKLPQNLLQSFVLRLNRVDVYVLQGEA
jgi:hypothetical protein